MLFYASVIHIVYNTLGQASAGENVVKLVMKHAPEWIRTSDPVIRNPVGYLWTTALADITNNIYNWDNVHLGSSSVTIYSRAQDWFVRSINLKVMPSRP